MLIVIKSSPHTEEAQSALKLAREVSADILLLQNGVYFVRQGRLEDIGTVYALKDDIRLRGEGAQGSGVRAISYDEMIDLMVEDKVIGMF